MYATVFGNVRCFTEFSSTKPRCVTCQDKIDASCYHLTWAFLNAFQRVSFRGSLLIKTNTTRNCIVLNALLEKRPSLDSVWMITALISVIVLNPYTLRAETAISTRAIFSSMESTDISNVLAWAQQTLCLTTFSQWILSSYFYSLAVLHLSLNPIFFWEFFCFYNCILSYASTRAGRRITYVSTEVDADFSNIREK